MMMDNDDQEDSFLHFLFFFEGTNQVSLLQPWIALPLYWWYKPACQSMNMLLK